MEMLSEVDVMGGILFTVRVWEDRDERHLNLLQMGLKGWREGENINPFQTAL